MFLYQKDKECLFNVSVQQAKTYTIYSLGKYFLNTCFVFLKVFSLYQKKIEKTEMCVLMKLAFMGKYKIVIKNNK